MRLFKVSEAYLKSIQSIDPFIPQNDCLVGIIYRLYDYIYFVPMDRDDENDYDTSGNVKNSPPFMIRMKDNTGTKCYGKCLISNMFAVPYKDLVPLQNADFNNAYEKKIEYSNDNLAQLIKDN